MYIYIYVLTAKAAFKPPTPTEIKINLLTTFPIASLFLFTKNPGKNACAVVDSESPKVVKKKKHRNMTWWAARGIVPIICAATPNEV
jgi:hypothetical protein